MKIADLVTEAHAQARASGWYEQDEATPAEIAVRLALIHAEVSEALEEVRRGVTGEAFAAELADVVLRVADLAGWLNIDLETALARKMARNAVRPYRHGGKVL